MVPFKEKSIEIDRFVLEGRHFVVDVEIFTPGKVAEIMRIQQFER